MKTIIAIWNTSSKGKSSIILEIAKRLLIQFPNKSVIFCNKDVNHLTVDFRLVIKINGKIIVLESQGDPGTKQEARLTGIDTDKIDADYMNSRFDKYLKVLISNRSCCIIKNKSSSMFP